MVEMWFQYERNTHFRSYSRKGTSQNEVGEDQDSKRMENTNTDQGHRKFPWICKLLSTLYLELQPHSKTIKWIEGQERMEMEWRTSKGIQGT